MRIAHKAVSQDFLENETSCSALAKFFTWHVPNLTLCINRLYRRTTVHRTVDEGQRVRHIGAVKCCAVKCALRVKQLRSEVCFASVF